ncbi:Sister chromatid cohesion protein pds5 [Coemansia sp. BCRC 34301]|nr:Sister chromatid cohesion protein pds5 [Coemansia sp. BCRC 34301]
MTEDGGPHQLSFEPKLFANVAQKKAIPIAELFKQLKKLSKELNGLEQETVDTQSLDSVTRQLLAPSLLRHKESGVVAYVACCIADILRLYAPEAPYSNDEIKAVFNVFIDQLQMLNDSNSQFFPLREYLLTSLATVRTPALVAMLPDSEEIISRFFTVLFGVVSPSQPHNIQMHILDVLQQLLEEPKTVPQDVIDVILLQFTKRRQQDNPATHQLASDLANATADILQKYIYQYFNDVIVSAAQQRVGQRQQESDGQRGRSGASDSMDDLRSAHYLILELNKSAPGTLLNVVPQLEEELGVDDVDIRILATGVLGEMFAEKGFTLAKRYESTWKTWKGRRADTSAVVRIQWIEHAVSLYQHQPQLSRELNEYIVEKLCDVDDKVRQVACHSLGLLEMSTPVQAAIGENVVKALGDRCKDRKPAVRSEAIIALATIYSQVFSELEQGAAAAQAKWGSIPSTIFMLRYINDPDIDSKVESILTGAILNFAKIKDDRSRCQRLLMVFESLTTKARSGFFSYMRRQQDIIRLTDLFLALCEKQGASPPSAADNGSGAVDQQLRLLAVKIAACFPDKAKVESALGQLANLHDAEVYRGLRETMDPKNDIKAVRKYQKGSLKKLSALAPSLLDTTAPLWKCVGLTTINRALVPFLIEHSSGSGRFAAAAEVLISYITSVFPDMLRSSSAELFDVAALQVADVLAIEERLVLMVKFAKAIPNSVPHSTELESQLAGFVRAGSLRQAKYAAYLVTQMDGARALCAALTGDVVDNLDNRHLERRAPSFAALSRLAQYAPDAFSTYSGRVSQFLVQSVLLSGPVDEAAEEEPEAEDWVSREALGEAGLSRVYAVKILTNWLVGLERQSLTRENVQLVLGTLRQLVRNSGAMQAGAGSMRERQHLLLTAAGCVLKLAGLAHFEKMLNTADVLSLGLVVQSPCFEVRSAFLLGKMVPALVAQRIHVRHIPALFLVAYEPEAAVRENVRHAIEQRLALMRPTPGSPSVVEDCICRLLYTLASHPDWDDAQPVATLELFAPYIEFYISCVCLSQNVSLLFCYAGEVKAYRAKGAASDVTTHRLYILSELAQYLLREKSMAANWPLNVYPGRLTLPADLYEPLPDTEKAAIPRKPFLDPEFVVRRAKAPAATKRSRAKPVVGGGPKSSREKSAAAAAAAAAKKRKAKAKGKAPANAHSDDEDDDADVAEDIEMSSVAETSDEDN